MKSRHDNPRHFPRLAEPSSQAQQISLSTNSSQPLTTLNGGESAVVQSLSGGASFRRRLAALGFTPGASIRMLQNLGHGPVLVTIRDTRIALGRGEACKIHVRPE
jgi:ferrous iron transport protein A